MDQTLGEFFATDERRRGEGVGFGHRWQAEDAPRTFNDLRWAPATGELYATSYIEQLHPGWFGPALGLWKAAQMVTVLAVIPNLGDLKAKLSGWQDQVNEYGSLEWVRQQVGRPRPAELFDDKLGDGQRRVCRG